MKGNFSYGLKLWSHDVKMIPEVLRVKQRDIFDYIELYVVPGTFHSSIKSWRALNIPFIIHAPHFAHGFNLARGDNAGRNVLLIKETRKFADTLSSPYIIVHPGNGGDFKETIRQLKIIRDDRFLVENKPLIGTNQRRCVGATFEELRSIVRATGCGSCLDISHAFKTAFCYGRDPYAFIEDLMKLKPFVVHFCDGSINGCYDEHLNMGEGEFKWKEIVDAIYRCNKRDDLFLTLETPKKDKKRLDDFERDIKFTKRVMNKYAR